MKLRLGLSPCPNDTFIFDALLHAKIDTEGLEFETFFADVEQLNKWAFEGRLDVTKLSFNAFTYCISDYLLLDSGSALGRKCGPLLIKKPETIINEDSKIAIPGRYTTANMLLEIAYPTYQNKIETCFSDIERAVIHERVSLGLIIHENRFTYKDKGLEKVIDLGEFWESETGLPIPLGGIVIKRKFTVEVQKRFERVLRRSVEYAFENRDSSSEFVSLHAQEMQREIVDAHINLYVNEYSISLGDKGREAVKVFFKKAGNNENSIFV
tara:strand:- start:1853 stop:2656 length:804 start_codon:yes stop_codon:yes gene_type:complete